MANKKNRLLSKVPLPDTFFSIKHQLRPIAPLRLSAPSAVVIYLLTLGGFVGCWIFYSLPNPPVTTTLIHSEWQKEGYVCKPLQPESHYKKMWTYDECQKNIREPNDESVMFVNSAQWGVQWKYNPIKGETISVKACESWDRNALKHGTYATTVGFPSPPGFDYNWDQSSCFIIASNYGCRCPGEKPVMIKLWKEFVGTVDLCLPFKENAPFQCTKTEITNKSLLEILSLSIANTQLLFGVLTAFCAYIFYKLKGKKEVTPVGEARWQEAVEQLRKEFQQALTKKADKTDYESV
jgi:hypothetical protein